MRLGSADGKVSLSVDECFDAMDSLNIGAENIADASQCLAGLKWQPDKFKVRLEPAREGCGDWLVRFAEAER